MLKNIEGVMMLILSITESKCPVEDCDTLMLMMND